MTEVITVPAPPLLEVSSLAVSYGAVVAVRDVSFAVAPGEIVAMLGANGAGKTTTLQAISGLVRARSGLVTFDGEDITRAAPEAIARLGIAHVPAGRGIFGSLSVADNLLMALWGAGSRDTKRVDEIYATFPILAQKRRQPAGELSGGQQQQLAIARALVQRPRLLLIDEMSMGLAPAIVAELFNLIGNLQDQGVAVLMVEQFVSEALRVADRAIVLEQGLVSASAAASELATEDVAAAYLGAAPQTDGLDGASVGPSVARESVTISLPGHSVRSLERLAASQGVTVGEVVADALADANGEAAS